MGDSRWTCYVSQLRISSRIRARVAQPESSGRFLSVLGEFMYHEDIYGIRTAVHYRSSPSLAIQNQQGFELRMWDVSSGEWLRL